MKTYKPTSASRRQLQTVNYKEKLSGHKVEKSLTKGTKRSVGRNNQGRITTRHKGGGNKRVYREIDFLYSKMEIPATDRF
jgi:large subunit ribosomal protein L2